MSTKSTSRRLFGSKAVFGAILLLVTYFGAAAVHAVKEHSSILVNDKSDDSYNNNYIGNSVDRRSRLLMHREKHSRGLLSTDEVKQQELDQEANERERMLRGVKGPRNDKLGEKTSDAVLVDDIEDDMDVMYGTTQGKKKKKRKKKTDVSVSNMSTNMSCWQASRESQPKQESHKRQARLSLQSTEANSASSIPV